MTPHKERAAPTAHRNGPNQPQRATEEENRNCDGIERVPESKPLRYTPLKRGTNRAFLSDWPRRASADPDQWRAWSREFPGCNFGVVTGDGVGVLDIDTKSAGPDDPGVGGFGSLIIVEEMLGLDLSNLPLVQTYSGAHLYFRYEGRLGSKVPWMPHLDVKADGGHQVAAPGTLRGGTDGERVYTLLRGDLGDIPFAPEQLLQAIRQLGIPRYGGSGGGHGVELPETNALRERGFRLGERDNGFNTLVWRLVRTHYPHMDLVRQLAFEVWQRTDNPDNDLFPWKKVEDQIARAEKAIGPDIEAQYNWAKRLRSNDA